MQQRKQQVADILPTGSGRAKITASHEFSQSTTATSIAFASVIIAYWELAHYFGLWMLFGVFTIVLGLLLLKAFVPKITQKLSDYGEVKPTLFEFLGSSYSSHYLQTVSSFVIIFGYLGVIGVEIVIGSVFVGALFPSVSIYVLAGVITLCVLLYTLIGGFRMVIKVDAVLMKLIWLMVICIIAFIFVSWSMQSEFTFQQVIPKSMYDFSYRENLITALIGFFVLNVTGFLVDLATWQRVSATKEKDVLHGGIMKSSVAILVSWSILCVAACLTPLVVQGGSTGMNSLVLLFQQMSSSGLFGQLIFIVCILGIFGAILSTSSTLLISIVHSIHSDILVRKNDGINSSRFITAIVTILAVIVVFFMYSIGFGVVDFVIAIFGSQISLFPVILMALFSVKAISKLWRRTAILSVTLSFAVGWVAILIAVYSKNNDLVFILPFVNLLVASVVIAIGFIFQSFLYLRKRAPYIH